MFSCLCCCFDCCCPCCRCSSRRSCPCFCCCCSWCCCSVSARQPEPEPGEVRVFKTLKRHGRLEIQLIAVYSEGSHPAGGLSCTGTLQTVCGPAFHLSPSSSEPGLGPLQSGLNKVQVLTTDSRLRQKTRELFWIGELQPHSGRGRRYRGIQQPLWSPDWPTRSKWTSRNRDPHQLEDHRWRAGSWRGHRSRWLHMYTKRWCRRSLETKHNQRPDQWPQTGPETRH